MLKVKTFIQKSDVHGMGLFAGEFIPKGTVTWEYSEVFDTGFTQEQVDNLPKIQRDYILYYAYLDKKINKLILCSDNQRFINHSKNTNIDSTPRQDVANRDIKEGEEFLCDYNKFDDTYFSRMNINQENLNV